jgi:hypothetical protein
MSFGDINPREASSNITNPIEAINIPYPIFLGEEGSNPFLFIQANRPITKGVNTTMYNGLKDWKTSGEIGLSAG